MRPTTYAVAILAVCLGCAEAKSGAVENAFAVCELLDGTGLTSQKCEVSGLNSSVTATIDMTPRDARNLCAKITALLAQRGLFFDSGWTLNIKSPYSGDNNIAFCKLP